MSASSQQQSADSSIGDIAIVGMALQVPGALTPGQYWKNLRDGVESVTRLDEAQRWIDWMERHRIGWTAWKLDVGPDSTNLLAEGAPLTGGWDGYLHGHAPFVIENLP